MKLTAKKLKELIMEEIANLHELDLDMTKRSSDPQAYLDSVIPGYMKGFENSPQGRKEVAALKQTIAEAQKVLEAKEIVVPVPERLREKYKGFINKAIKTWVEEAGDQNKGKMDFAIIKRYLEETIIGEFKLTVAEDYGLSKKGGLDFKNQNKKI